jgi:peptidoglycan lytic transglycosylase G
MPIFRRHDESPRERTAEERERARAEREARRAARSGTVADPRPRETAPEEPVAARPPRETLPPSTEFAPLPPDDSDFAHDTDDHDFAFPSAPQAFAPERSPVLDPRDTPREPLDEPDDTDLQPTAPFDPLTDDTSEGVAVEDPAHDIPSGGPAPEAAEENSSDDLAVAGTALNDSAPEAVAEEAPSGDPAPEEAAREVPSAAAEEPALDGVAEEPASGGFAEEVAVGGDGIAPVGTAEEPAPGGFAGATAAGVDERPPIVPPAARRARSGRAAVAVDDGERPVAPKRISAADRRLPPTPPLPGTPAFSHRRRRRGRILAVFALLLLAAFLFGLNLLFEPFKGEGTETVTVRIPPNSSVADVGNVLADNDIVDSSFLFVVRARLAGADLKAGTYQLKKDSSYGDALDDLNDDPAAPRTIKVVIPEGRSRQETAPIVKDAGLDGSYLEASDTQKGFKPRKYGAPRNTKTLEGFLFPATYELSPGSASSKLVKQQLATFEENVAKVDMKRARKRNLTTYDVLIIASMVEREATLPKERPIIAAVIHNRLRQGMPLGIDATIRYAVRNWTEPLKQSELNIDSPYNTRKHTGLPPTPIGSPGLDSIRAAANPANVKYLFYVVKPGGNGAHNFSSTDEEFQRDVDAYNRERERRGGKSPASG